MWKWTDINHLKAIILDGDTLDKDYMLYDYSMLIPGCKVYPVTTDKKEGMISYFDITALLGYLLQNANCDSFQILSISSNPQFLKEMMQNHIGTIYAGCFKREYLKYTPDFTNKEFKNLPSILSHTRYGYAAEVIACNEYAKKKNLLSCEAKLKLNNGDIKNFKLYFGGRYYAKNHRYLSDDPLSTLILEFKNKPVKAISEYFDQAIEFLRPFETMDILTYVPLKPDEIAAHRFNRFESLELNRCQHDNLELCSIVACCRSFSQKRNDTIHRNENVKGVYAISQNIQNKKILIIDDVYSTGATITEIVKTLYEAGAAYVSALFIGVNQLTESPANLYQAPICSACGGKLQLRLNSKTNQLFWGCANYGRGCHVTKTCEQGLQEMGWVNRLNIADFKDLEDYY